MRPATRQRERARAGSPHGRSCEPLTHCTISWPWIRVRRPSTTSARSSRARPKGPPPRVCPSCGAEHATAACRSAPAAASATTAASRASSDTQRWILAGVALAGVIVAAILILPGVFDAKRDNDARARPRARRRASRPRYAPHEPRAAPDARPPRRASRRPARPRAPPSSSPPATSSCSRSRARSSPTRATASRTGELDGPVKPRQLRAADPQPGNLNEETDLSQAATRASTASRSSATS